MKNKGFTLIELLAVIVILAIIAVIAVPIVLNIINDVKDNASKRSIDMYARAVENAVARYQLTKGDIPNTYDEVKDYIEYNGAEVICEDFRIYSDGTTYLNHCTVDDKYINYSKGNAIGSGTIADSILKQYGGISNITSIDTNEVKERVISYYKGMGSNTDTKKFGSSFEYSNETKKYTLTSDIGNKTLSECQANPSSCQYFLSYNEKELHNSTNFEFDTVWATYVFDITKKGYVKAFDANPTEEESGLYKMIDDLGDSYYFRGNVKNNYVRFGSYSAGTQIIQNNYIRFPDGGIDSPRVTNLTLNEETSMYWRIVRINGDGTIRLVYDGIEKLENGTEHTTTISKTAFTNKQDLKKYAGYTYNDGTGNQVDSTIKGVLDDWYENNLKQNYGKYIADSIFCNDRRITQSEGEWAVFKANEYIINNSLPELTCEQKEDRYTLNNDIGNGYMKNPIGLLTASEVMMAGEPYDDPTVNSENKNLYLYSGDGFVTMTPYFAEIEEGSFSSIFIISYGEGRGLIDIQMSGARPVINLKADVKFTGNGSFETPYEIVME